jgi:CheY-like chemotaxis protein
LGAISPSKASWRPEAASPWFSPPSDPTNPSNQFPPSPSPRPSGAEIPTKGSVLLVEDDAVSASALRTILTRLGWKVTEAPTIRDARASLHQPFQVVVLDLMLPDGDGASVLRQIREAKLNCRVAVTTGVSDPRRLDILSTLKPDLVLRKPIDVQQLLRFLDMSTPN